MVVHVYNFSTRQAKVQGQPRLPRETVSKLNNNNKPFLDLWVWLSVEHLPDILGPGFRPHHHRKQINVVF